MYSPVTSQFLASCRQSSKIATVCDFYVAGTLIKANVPILDGSITSDANADVRRSAHMTIVNPSAVPSSGDTGNTSGRASTMPDLRQFFGSVDIYQTEVVVKAGFVYSFGNVELIPMGRFMVWTASLDFTRGDVIELELYDRSKYLQQTDILKLYDFSGTSAQAAIQTLVTASMPSATTVVFQAGLSDVILPGGSTYDTTHLDAILALAEILGATFYFDYDGVARVDKKKTITSSNTIADSVFDCKTGESNGNIISLTRSSSRDEIYNGVGVYGSSPNETVAQPYGEAFDMNTASRTYWQGPFGKSFKRIDRPELVTSADCLAAAQAELARSVAAAVPTSIDILFNPALVVNDYIAVYYPTGDPEIHLIDTIDFDFAEAHMGLTTRGQTVSG